MPTGDVVGKLMLCLSRHHNHSLDKSDIFPFPLRNFHGEAGYRIVHLVGGDEVDRHIERSEFRRIAKSHLRQSIIKWRA